MPARIPADQGVTQVVRLRLLPSVEQEQLLRSYCGTARVAWNQLLTRVVGNVAQREAERSYGIPEEDLTPVVSWHKYGLEKLLREHRDDWVPWHAEVPYLVLDRTAHHLAAGLAKWKAGQAKFPRRRRRKGPNAGMVPVTFKETGAAWLSDGGRQVALPVSKATRDRLGRDTAQQLSRVLVVKDNRGRRAAKLIRDGRGQVQEVTFSHSGGYWWAAVRLRVLPAAATRTRAAAARAHVVLGLDAGMGATFATLNTPVQGLTDADGKIAAPQYLRRAQAQLADAQRWLARTERGSKRHRKALRRVRKLHGRVTGRRDTFHHTLAIALVEQAPLLAVEDLNLRGMARRKTGSRGFRFGRSVADNGWASFVQVLCRQASKRGAALYTAPRFYPSSKTCSACGAVTAKLPLAERTYQCTTCTTRCDRDVNAARNLAALARTTLADTGPPGTAEPGLLPAAA